MTTPADRRNTPTPGAKPPRRTRSVRLWLPYAVIVLALVGYGLFWLAARGMLEARLAHQADRMRRTGYTVALEGQRIGGFPFRLRLHYDRVRVVGPSGWGVAAPELDAQAFVYAPGHWVIVAQQGLEVERGGDGPLSIEGDQLRASIAGAQMSPWRIALEGEGLRFSTSESAHPFTLTRADRFDVLLRPAPAPPHQASHDSGDSNTSSGGQLLLRLTKASVSPSSALAPIAGVQPLTLDLALRLTKPEAFKGPAFAAAVRAWAKAGGEAQVVRFQMDAGRATLSAGSGALAVADDGRLRGAVPLHVVLPSGLAVLPIAFGGHVSIPTRIVAVAVALVRGAGGALDAPVTFQDGRIVLEGFAVGKAPQIYRPAIAAAQAKLGARP